MLRVGLRGDEAALLLGLGLVARPRAVRLGRVVVGGLAHVAAVLQHLAVPVVLERLGEDALTVRRVLELRARLGGARRRLRPVPFPAVCP